LGWCELDAPPSAKADSASRALAPTAAAASTDGDTTATASTDGYATASADEHPTIAQ
jgi:hypothetical protein